MDDINRTNRERWNALANANFEYTLPFLNYTIEEARKRIGRHGILTDVAGKRVLCLASGGGQALGCLRIVGCRGYSPGSF